MNGENRMDAQSQTAILEIDELSYSFVDGTKKRVILDHLSCVFEKGKFYTILGPSGSGKSTLLALCAALDQPEDGRIEYKGQDIRKLGYTRFRRDHIAIIFQKYNLLDYLTGAENVETDMMISNRKMKARRELAYKILEVVGIVKTKADRLVTTLSGGEQQRVAIARALAKDVELILGDEPTGALDTATQREVISMFKRLARDHEKTIIVVTHSDEVAKQSDIILKLRNGKLEK